VAGDGKESREVGVQRQPSSTDEEGRTVEDAPRDLEAVGKAALEQYGSETRLAVIGLVTSAVIKEFNDPLQAMGNILGGINRRGIVEAEDLGLIGLAHEELQKLNALVHELQEFCHPDTEGKKPLDMAAEAERILQLVQARLSPGKIKLETDIDRELPLVHAEADLIRWVLEETVVNLIDSCEDRAVLDIKVYNDDGAVVFQVMEKECGLDQEMMKRLLEAFKKGGKKAISGLWLAICSAIVVMHDGLFEVGSADGTGTVIRMSLPAADAPQPRGG